MFGRDPTSDPTSNVFRLMRTLPKEFGLQDDGFVRTAMDWNSRFAVKHDGLWFPVVGWNHYPNDVLQTTVPILFGLRGSGSWEEFRSGDYKYKIVTSKKKWRKLIEVARA